MNPLQLLIRKKKIDPAKNDPIFGLPLAPPQQPQSSLESTLKDFSAQNNNYFFQHEISKSREILESKDENYFLQAGKQRALALFKLAADRVPAYQDFLKKNKVKPEKITTFAHFEQVPWIDKANYLERYPLNALSWDGLLETNQMISVSSGSSGTSFYWPRGALLDTEGSLNHEMILKEIFNCQQQRTLFVNAFAMGMYVAGPYTLNSVLNVSRKGYAITLITPGLEIRDAVRAIEDVMDLFDQVVIAGYPPFVKDIIDMGITKGIKWSSKRVRFLLAGEGFNESWREYVAGLVGQRKTLLQDFVNIYGTADAAIVGHETPTSVAIRRLAAQKDEVFKALFPEEKGGRLPTFVQHYPTAKYFETVDNELIFTATAGIPLIRYNIHDLGGVMTYSQALAASKISHEELTGHLQKSDEELNPWRLPFVYLYGKIDHTVTLYGLNIYPENIKLALVDPKIRHLITGRFTMSTEYEKSSRDQYLLINIERSQQTHEENGAEQAIVEVIVKTLREVNSEYNKLYGSIGADRARPVIKLYNYGESEYFARGIKQDWGN